MLKALAARLPGEIQSQLKRAYFRTQIWRSRFTADAPEYARLHEWVAPGDICIDVGSNVGQYARRMAELVAPEGVVFAIEPMHETFRLLASNVGDLANVILLNMAASDRSQDVYMELPRFGSGLNNYYRASISTHGTHHVRAIPLDSLELNQVALIKIDAEGHDLEVLQGAQRLIQQSRPKLIVEENSGGIIAQWMREHDYKVIRLPGSCNVVGIP